MKRILYTEYSSGFGGSSTVLYDFLKNLNRAEYQPVVVVARDGHNFNKTKDLGIEVIKAPIKVIGLFPRKKMSSMGSMILDLILYLIPNILTIGRIIRQKDIDLVHINNNIKHCVDVILAAKLTGTPCVCHIRETMPVCKMDRLFGRFVRQIIVLNQTVYKNIKSIVGTQKTRIIPDGIDLNVTVDQYNALKIKEDFKLSGFYCIGFLGRIVEGKGVDIFIRSAAIVRQKFPNIRFLIVGDNSDPGNYYLKYLEHIIQEEHLGEEIIFTGWRSDKFDLISILDILVQASSTPEGFGLTCIEAMALEKPVVATNVPGPCDIIEHGKTGCLIQPRNPYAMAEAIIKLIEHPEFAQFLARGGKRSVEQRFNIKYKAKEIEEMYEEFLITEKN